MITSERCHLEKHDHTTAIFASAIGVTGWRARMADFSEFPDVFPASSENAKREYLRSDTHFAVHGRKSSPGATIELNSEKIAVYPISRLSDFSEAVQSIPVYALQPGG